MGPLIQMEILIVHDVSALTQPLLKRRSFADLFLVRQKFVANYLEITACKILLRKNTIFFVIFRQEVQTNLGAVRCTWKPVGAFIAFQHARVNLALFFHLLWKIYALFLPLIAFLLFFSLVFSRSWEPSVNTMDNLTDNGWSRVHTDSWQWENLEKSFGLLPHGVSRVRCLRRYIKLSMTSWLNVNSSQLATSVLISNKNILI